MNKKLLSFSKTAFKIAKFIFFSILILLLIWGTTLYNMARWEFYIEFYSRILF